MKRFLSAFALSAAVLFLLNGCKKDEKRVTFEGGTAPVLTANRTTNIPLSFANKDQEAITFSWTNPNYKFNTGASSQNVSYQLEIDTTGANFTNPAKRTVSISSDLSKTYTQEQFNDLLLNGLELKPGMPHNLDVRVKSTIGGTAVPLLSNVMKFTVTPYALPPKVQPYTADVFIVGNATPGGWNNPVPSPAQKFTQISPTQYEITMPLVGGNSYLFLPENGSWSRKYGFDGSNNSNNPDGDNFVREGGDIKAPAQSGNYKIELNFQTGKFKLTKQ